MQKPSPTALPLALLSLLLAAGQMKATEKGEGAPRTEARRTAVESLKQAIGYPSRPLQVMAKPEVLLDITLRKDGRVVIHQLQSDNPFLAQEVRSRLRHFKKERPADLRLRLKLRFE